MTIPAVANVKYHDDKFKALDQQIIDTVKKAVEQNALKEKEKELKKIEKLKQKQEDAESSDSDSEAIRCRLR